MTRSLRRRSNALRRLVNQPHGHKPWGFSSMHFLHTDAEQAALALCEQDVQGYLHEALAGLQVVVSGKSKFDCDSSLVEWLDEDGFNYHWLAYFAERLSKRHSRSTSYWSEIMSLRRSVPTKLACRQLTPVPIHPHELLKHVYFCQVNGVDHIIAAYRADYVLSRHGHAEWTTAPVPAWFHRIANTILPERDRQAFLLRVQPAGPSGAVNEGSGLAERKELRDGPSCEITGDDSRKFGLW